jgi:hypothetical protein
VSDEDTNFTLLQRSRKKVRTGDAFTFQVLDGPFRFGRVVAAELGGPMPYSHLLYIYRTEALDPTDPPLDQLVPDNLLIPRCSPTDKAGCKATSRPYSTGRSSPPTCSLRTASTQSAVRFISTSEVSA